MSTLARKLVDSFLAGNDEQAKKLFETGMSQTVKNQIADFKHVVGQHMFESTDMEFMPVKQDFMIHAIDPSKANERMPEGEPVQYKVNAYSEATAHEKAKNKGHVIQKITNAVGEDVTEKAKNVAENRDMGAWPVNESLNEGMKLVSQHGEGQHTAKVYKDSDWDEYRVKFYKDGKHVGKASDYHSDDLDDAQSTADSQIKRYGQVNESTSLSDYENIQTNASVAAHGTEKGRMLYQAYKTSPTPENKAAYDDHIKTHVDNALKYYKDQMNEETGSTVGAHKITAGNVYHMQERNFASPVRFNGWTDDDQKYGEGKGKFAHLKAIPGINKLADVESKANSKEYGYGHYAHFTALDKDGKDDYDFNAYVHKGRLSVGSGADPVSLKQHAIQESVDVQQSEIDDHGSKEKAVFARGWYAQNAKHKGDAEYDDSIPGNSAELKHYFNAGKHHAALQAASMGDADSGMHDAFDVFQKTLQEGSTVNFNQGANDVQDEPIGAHAHELETSVPEDHSDHSSYVYAAGALKQNLPAKEIGDRIRPLDTAVRDHVLSYVHPSHWESMGYPAINMEKSLQAHVQKFGITESVPAVTRDLDKLYAKWQSDVASSHPQHANNLRFVSKPDARHLISAQVKNKDQCCGVFDTGTGRGQVLAEDTGTGAVDAAITAQQLAAKKQENIEQAHAASKQKAPTIQDVVSVLGNTVSVADTSAVH